MALYGRQTQGASWIDCEIDVFGRLITLPGGEAIVATYVYLQTTAGVSTANVKAALYRVSDDSLAYESNQLAVAEDIVGGWKIITWPATTPDAGQYYLSIAAGAIAGGANTINIAYDVVAGTTDFRGETNLLAGAQSIYPTLPNPIVWGGTDGTYDISIYLETGGGVVPRTNLLLMGVG